MTSSISPSAPESAAGAGDLSLAVEVDRDGRIASFAAGWDALVQRHEATALGADAWLGRSLESCFEPPIRDAWRELLARAVDARPDRPPATPPADDPVSRALAVWPIFGAEGRVERLRVWPRIDLDDLLGRPLVEVGEDGLPRGINRAGRGLIEAAADDGLGLAEWLALMQPPRRLVPIGLRLATGGGLHAARPAAVWDDGWGTVLARVVRSGLHDLANPLAGARMLAEVLRLGDPDGGGGGVVEHLDATNAGLRRLRGLLAADQRRRIDLREAFVRSVEGLGSELARREVEVEVDALPEREVTHPEASALPFALALVLAATVRAAPGDRIVLALIPCLDGGWRLEAHTAGHAPPPKVVDPAIEPALLRRLAVDLGGRLAIEPGSRPQRDPEWAVEWPPRTQSRSR